MCVKIDMLIKGMLSEKEMHELVVGEKHQGYKITEKEFTAFWWQMFMIVFKKVVILLSLNPASSQNLRILFHQWIDLKEIGRK